MSDPGSPEDRTLVSRHVAFGGIFFRFEVHLTIVTAKAARPADRWRAVMYAWFMRYPDGGGPLVVVWNTLANLARRNIGQLTALVRTRLRRMQYRPGLLHGFLASTGLDLTPFCNPSN